MTYTATITSKNQLTLPAALVKQANLKAGQKLSVTQDGTSLKLEPIIAILNRLEGSVPVPPRFRGLSEDQIIAQAKKEYFSKSP